MKSHDEMVKEWKQDPLFQQEYDALEAEFLLLDELLSASAKKSSRKGAKAQSYWREIRVNSYNLY